MQTRDPILFGDKRNKGRTKILEEDEEGSQQSDTQRVQEDVEMTQAMSLENIRYRHYRQDEEGTI